MSFWKGDKLSLEIFGTSHGASIGMNLIGVPEGTVLDLTAIDSLLERRKANSEAYSTRRHEPDVYSFVEGVTGDTVSGAKISAIIENKTANSADYDKLHGIMRPGHADFAAYSKYGKDVDLRGGGKYSGRMTAPLCIAGGIAMSILKERGVNITSYLSSVGSIYFGSYREQGFILPHSDDAFALATPDAKRQADAMFRQLGESGDSTGGTIDCVVTGLKAGFGDALFDAIESKIASLAFAIPAVKAIEFGYGSRFSEALGSEVRDELFYDGTEIKTKTNFNGGINGGISNGMPICFSVTIKPTSSIAKPCQTVDVIHGKNVELEISGRHDVCIAPRAVPAVASVCAIALLDYMVD